MAPASEDLFDAEPPTSINPYEVLGLEKEATAEQIKAAYRRAALLNHPDKVPDSEKATAHTKFQSIAFAYAILSDPRRRSRYDVTGRTEETLSLDDEDEDFNWSDYFRAQFTDVITSANIDAFRAEWKGSEEEKEALIQAFVRGKGDLDVVYESVMLSDVLEDDGRFREILDGEIKAGRVERYKKYVEESESRRKRRVDAARREREEAEEVAAEEEEEKKKKGKGKSAKSKAGAGSGKNDLGSLAALIQQRQKGRQQDFLADLEAKYAAPGKNKKRGSPAVRDEPSEEAFQATAARLKKGKEEREVNGDGGRRSKRAKK